MPNVSRILLGLTLTIAPILQAQSSGSPRGGQGGWSSYGGDPGGSRHSSLAQITRDNVSRLAPVWTIRTGDATHPDHSEGPREGCARCHTGASKFEATPILAEGRLYLSTPLNRVLAGRTPARRS